MLFRSRIVENEAKEGVTESKRMVSEKIVSSIKSDFNNALKCYNNKNFFNSVANHFWYKDPAIAFMQKFSMIERLSLEELSELLCNIEKLQSKIERVQIAIIQLKNAVEKSIAWSREGIFSVISKLTELNRNLPKSVFHLILHQEYSNDLQKAINHMHKDAMVTANKKPHEFAMVNYWSADVHWQKIFEQPAFSHLVTYAISTISNLEGMTTNENCNLIYNIHEKGNESSIYELSKGLTELLEYDKTKRRELNFTIAPFVDFGHRIDLTARLSAILQATVSEYKPPAEVPVEAALVVVPSAPSPPAYDEEGMVKSVVKQEGEPDQQVLDAISLPVSDVSVRALQQQGRFRRSPENKEPLMERRVVPLVFN